MKNITIAFKKIREDSDLISKIIGWKQGTKYSHVEIGFEVKPSVYNSLVALPVDSGIYLEEKMYFHDKWDTMQLEVTDKQYALAMHIVDGYVGKRYDKLGIAGFVLPVRDEEGAWFCSEAVANVLKCLGHKDMFYVEPSRVGIKRLLEILDFENNKK